MNRFTGSLSVAVLGIATVWAQAPAATQKSPATQASTAQAPAASTGAQQSSTASAQPKASAQGQQASISGCMTERFGIFTVNDTATSKSWQVKAPGTSLYNDENHVVSVKGVADPSASTPTVYAENVQPSGQPCGNAQAANGTAQPGSVQGPQAQPAAGATAANGQNPASANETGSTNSATGAVSGSTASQTSTTGATSSSGIG